MAFLVPKFFIIFYVHNNLANDLAKQEKWEEAINHYNEALRQKPNYASAPAITCILCGITNEEVKKKRGAGSSQDDAEDRNRTGTGFRPAGF